MTFCLWSQFWVTLCCCCCCFQPFCLSEKWKKLFIWERMGVNRPCWYSLEASFRPLSNGLTQIFVGVILQNIPCSNVKKKIYIFYENYFRIAYWVCFRIVFLSSIRACKSNLRKGNFAKFTLSKCENNISKADIWDQFAPFKHGH